MSQRGRGYAGKNSFERVGNEARYSDEKVQ
jgi:hypothetical protein